MVVTNLCDFSILETLILRHGSPVDVRLVPGMLHNREEEHCLRGRRLLLGRDARTFPLLGGTAARRLGSLLGRGHVDRGELHGYWGKLTGSRVSSPDCFPRESGAG